MKIKIRLQQLKGKFIMCLVNTKAGRAMESINFNLLFELFLILFGIYLIISANKMKRTKEPATLLVQEELKNCRDKKGFATEMEGKLRFLGAVIAAYGVIGSVNDVYLAYKTWCASVGCTAMKKLNVSRAIKRRYNYDTKITSINGKSVRIYKQNEEED